MKKFHFVFKDKEEDHMSKGDVIEASCPIEAIEDFELKNPNVIFLAMFDDEIVRNMHRIFNH